MDNVTNYHVQYLDVTSQHWDPKSAKFAGGDHLLTALNNGWDVADCVQEQHWYEGMRCINVYHFTLVRHQDRMVMPVINNPYVNRFILQAGILVREAGTSGAQSADAALSA